MMKIAILGAGAMGSLFGGYLAKSNNQVYLIDINEGHVEAINTKGLIIRRQDDELIINDIKATTKPNELGEVDLLIVFVKSTVTKQAMEGVKEIISDKTIIMTLQNGIGNIEKIKEVMPENKIFAGTTSNGSTMVECGIVYHAGKGKTTIGDINGLISDELKGINDIFNSVGIETSITDNPIGLIWDKLLVNIGINALTAVTGFKNGMLLDYDESERILELSVKEALAVANKLGIKLNISDPIEHTKEICRITKDNTSSMLQDVINNKTTEIDMINGAIVQYGESLGVITPINLMLRNLVKLKSM